MPKNEYAKLDELIRSLHSETDRDTSLDIAIEAANEFMRIVFPKSSRGRMWAEELLEGEDLLDETIPASSFPNQKSSRGLRSTPISVVSALQCATSMMTPHLSRASSIG